MSTATLAKERLAQRFALWDNDNDGLVERSDYEAEAKDIIKAFSESESSPKAKKIIDAYTKMFDVAAQKLGIPADGGLNPEQFHQVSEELVTGAGAAGFDAILRPAIEAVLDLADSDGDGELNQAEFARWIKATGSPADPADLFSRLDTNKSGSLTTDELVASVRDYHQGKHDIPLLGR